MLGKDYVGQDCGIARALEVIGERWTLLIVRDALYGVRHFRDFQAHLDVPKAVLSDRLSGLVEHGILERRPDPDHAGRSLYELTESPAASCGRCCTRWSCGARTTTSRTAACSGTPRAAPSSTTLPTVRRAEPLPWSGISSPSLARVAAGTVKIRSRWRCAGRTAFSSRSTLSRELSRREGGPPVRQSRTSHAPRAAD